MKYFFVLLILIGFFSSANAIQYQSSGTDKPVNSENSIHVVPEILWDIHDVILDGTIVEYDDNTWTYHIKINHIFKGSLNSDLISAEGFDVWNNFKKGDRALFYIYDISPVSTNYKYKITGYSVKTTPTCDARSLIQITPTLPNEGSFVRGAPTIPADWEDPCVPNYFSYDPDFFNFREAIAPLKQIKHKIPIDKIQCRDNLQLILKTSNNSPACVKPETKTKLLERGWGEHAPIPEPEIIKETDFDSEKYYEEFDSGSPLIYLDTSNPVLDNANCERYAYWLTKYQKEKLDKYEDYPRYPPWGNQIFPLVDYCITNGDLIKTIVNDKIQWSFSGISGNSEPEFKDEKITIIKISKGEIVSEKAIKFNGWTNQPNQEIVLTVTAPNGNVISTGKLSSMNNGTFADSITTGGPLWEQQDGIYLVTVQQGNEPMNSAYFELELKDGNIITGK